MITGRHVALDRVGLLQRVAQQGRRDRRRVDFARRKSEAIVRDHVEISIGVFVRRPAGSGRNVVDEALVERPGIHPTLPLVNDRIPETEGLGLHVGHAGLPPRFPRSLHRLGRGGGEKRVDRARQPVGRQPGILIARLGEVRIVGDNRVGCDIRRMKRCGCQKSGCRKYSDCLHRVIRSPPRGVPTPSFIAECLSRKPLSDCFPRSIRRSCHIKTA